MSTRNPTGAEIRKRWIADCDQIIAGHPSACSRWRAEDSHIIAGSYAGAQACDAAAALRWPDDGVHLADRGTIAREIAEVPLRTFPLNEHKVSQRVEAWKRSRRERADECHDVRGRDSEDAGGAPLGASQAIIGRRTAESFRRLREEPRVVSVAPAPYSPGEVAAARRQRESMDIDSSMEAE